MLKCLLTFAYSRFCSSALPLPFLQEFCRSNYSCVLIQLGIKKKSKVPGVMITQFKEELPEGKTTPDFTRKPIAVTIQEGKFLLV